MAKPTPTKEDQPFIYQLGHDVAKLGFEVESLKNKTVKAIRIVVPAKPEKYQQYELKAVINLPPECQNAICIKSENGNVELIETGETMSVYTNPTASEFYLAPIYRLEAETVNAALDQEQMSDIDAAQEREERERQERQEREERERQERQEREERERQERQEREERERQERAEREELIYKYLAKWLTDNYLESVRAEAKDSYLENNGVNVYVNKNGLQRLLNEPFERNTQYVAANLNEATYADAKSAMLAEKDRIDRGGVDLSTASDFELVDYNYINNLS